MPKVVFFDVGNTLIFADPSVPEMFTAVAREFSYDLNVRDVEQFMPEVDAFYEREYLRDGDFWCSHERATRIWKDMYVLLGQLVGITGDLTKLSEEVHERYYHGDAWSIFPDVKGSLKTLKRQGMRLGVISNWDARLKDLLRELGLLPYFDTVISSAEVGYRKPDRVIFELAAEQMGVLAADCVHVGDLPEADGAAAQAGMTPLIIDRRRLHGNCGFDCLESLVELPGVIQIMLDAAKMRD